MFVEPDRKGTVLGNKVTASPVTVNEMLAVQQAGKESEEAAIMAMKALIAAHVRDDEGAPIDPNILSARAIKSLFKFIADTEGDASDFT